MNNKGWLLRICYIAFSLFFLTAGKSGIFAPQITRGLFIGGVSFIAIIESMTDRNRAVDVVLLLMTAASTAYFILEYPNLGSRAGIVNGFDKVLGMMMITVCIETSRRKNGLTLSLIALFFFAYNIGGGLLPGILGHGGLSLGRTVGFLYTSLFGIYGSVAGIFSTYVFMFVLFGAVLRMTGGAEFFTQLPYLVTGKSKTGSAKSAVIASALMGSVTGSAVANVMTTGTFTIPLMKKAGFESHEAAAIETAASTGGQLMPPVMGAGAFVMAELTGVPYSRIILVSVAPALLYFISIYIMIDMKKERSSRVGIDRKQVVDLVKGGWHHFIPLAMIFFLLIKGHSPVFASFWSIMAAIAANLIFSREKIGLRNIMDSLEDCGKNIAFIGTTAGAIGIIIGTVYLTGLGFKFSSLILGASMGILPLMIFFVALASYVLGMGLTVTSSYIILAVLAAPAFVDKGVSVLGAHMIIFWLSQDANITPPVCLAAYAAAGIAGANPLRTGVAALKYAKIIYVVPLLIVYTPLIDGSPVEIIILSSASILLIFVVHKLYNIIKIKRKTA
ncbi:TRAP transporter, 4TM/12TM fusion protein [Dethiosulfatibacter aminovorans DSM 17477]|uniref:TRAP transporter, 4TM/12TM fusion protein n=1 Tax=Dethiosulfatibacter aminovorans DSM 17477 TaxID=1121476 RepID=A0A1M6HAH8_9FIRM|nr:TRAP transporter fused permease subunit [Dethiosulfatibacter aminovorans]SHJ19232.1 TRAP transporter, 4TM/12TM fusion protein [Dethiosulfatibacter aminovorans DSM 17477]